MDQIFLKTDQRFNLAAYAELAYRALSHKENLIIVDEETYRKHKDTDEDIKYNVDIRHAVYVPIFEEMYQSDEGVQVINITRVFTEAEWNSILERRAQHQYNQLALNDFGLLKEEWKEISEDDWVSSYAKGKENLVAIQEYYVPVPFRLPLDNSVLDEYRYVTQVEIETPNSIQPYRYFLLSCSYEISATLYPHIR